ncbi:MAG: 2OG-Fe(II) oxygenase [Achromobacter sp.]|uniref:2OG-Fe(II) oxygenase n=1 Tax=Achromobacter sp. TaxID=134375 RepID=UPI003CFF5D22
MNAPLPLDRYDWARILEQLDTEGWAPLPALFSPAQARALARAFDDPRTVPTGAADGTCRSLPPPLPHGLDALQARLHARLAPLARTWARRLERAAPAATAAAPACLSRLRQDDCQPLRHAADGAAFPFGLIALLSEPGHDFSGGEFVMTEQRPRQQSRPMVLPLARGDGAVIAVAHRPVQGASGDYRATLRRAISRVRGGERMGLSLPLDGPPAPP